ncbi:MAG: DUF493 domain-containing protein [Neisseriaceae bacterium]
MSEDLEKVETLFNFPCQFPIKVMGHNVEQLVEEVLKSVRPYAPTLEREHISVRASRQGNYLGLTINIHATSKEQLDAIYLVLTSHPLVKVVL